MQISFKNMLCSFIEMARRHRFSPVDLLHIFRTSFCKNTYGGLLQYMFGFELLFVYVNLKELKLLFSQISSTWWKYTQNSR